VAERPASILDRPVYGVPEAAALLGLRAGWARAWLDGCSRLGVSYQPVIRVEPTGDEIVTWESSSSWAISASITAREYPSSGSDQ
jgi:hypothetical protein